MKNKNPVMVFQLMISV